MVKGGLSVVFKNLCYYTAVIAQCVYFFPGGGDESAKNKMLLIPINSYLFPRKHNIHSLYLHHKNPCDMLLDFLKPLKLALMSVNTLMLVALDMCQVFDRCM